MFGLLFPPEISIFSRQYVVRCRKASRPHIPKNPKIIVLVERERFPSRGRVSSDLLGGAPGDMAEEHPEHVQGAQAVVEVAGTCN